MQNWANYVMIWLGKPAKEKALERIICDENKKTLRIENTSTRLAEGMYKDNCITPEAMERCQKCFYDYRRLLDKYNVTQENVRAITTAACRMAKNGNEVVRNIFAESGIKLEVIDGKEEAELNLKGAIEHVLEKGKTATLRLRDSVKIGENVRCTDDESQLARARATYEENAKKIKTVVNNIVSSVSEANKASADASNAFAKVSLHADQVINSLKEITERINNIGSQMDNIRTKNDETAVAAEKISSFCGELAEKQQSVSADVDYMNNLFLETRKDINQIKKDTGDIVTRIRVVSDTSKESYKNMTDLENILEQFKTNSEVEEAVSQADAENTITTIISPELESSAELFVSSEENKSLDMTEVSGFEDLLGEVGLAEANGGNVSEVEEISFDPDDVEEF